MAHVASAPTLHDGHVRFTYQDIHTTIGVSALEIKAAFAPELLISIAGGGAIPCRILRSFLKLDGRNLQIQTVALSLYEELENTSAETIGKEVVRVQWINCKLAGRRILIVDEVDDTRTTLGYAVTELQRDIDSQLAAMTEAERAVLPETKLAVFVVHNKLKPKACSLPASVAYFAGENIEDKWIDYPWEASDILLHDALAAAQPKH